MMSIDEKVKKIQLDRIGDSCFYDAVSCLLEYEDKLYWALEYVDYKFLYEPTRFLKFGDKKSFVLSPTDNYYFLNGTGSCAYKDNSRYTYMNYKQTLEKMLEYRNDSIDNFFDIFQYFAEKEVPFILKVNNMEYRDFYKENRFTVPRSDCRHLIDVLSVSKDGKKCFVFDRGFDCFGEWIDTERLYDGAASAFLENKSKFTYMYFKDGSPEILDRNQIKNKFLENIKRALQLETHIGKYKYLNNSVALYAFRNDFDKIVKVLEEKYEKLAAAMIGEAILLQVDGVMGVVGLYKYVNCFVKSQELQKIIPELRKYWEIWHEIELRLKYITYKGSYLSKYKKIIIKYIDELIKTDLIIIEGLKLVLRELEGFSHK